ncbi:basic proline-rich protein-like [Gorilla gorilla gorilla]|uniref:basic proline-rich protein-like n=1 Tax=Gorilla gorilla gorilla TaxID=9595 RepID=UPI00300AD324
MTMAVVVVVGGGRITITKQAKSTRDVRIGTAHIKEAKNLFGDRTSLEESLLHSIRGAPGRIPIPAAPPPRPPPPPPPSPPPGFIHPPSSRAAVHSRLRAAPAAAPRLLPRVLAGAPARNGALAGSRLRAAAAAAHDQEAAAPTGRRWRRRPGPSPPLQPRSRHPHTRYPRAVPEATPLRPPPGTRPRAKSRPGCRSSPFPARSRTPGEAGPPRGDPRPRAPRPGDHPRRSPALRETPSLSPPSPGRRNGKRAAGKGTRPPTPAAAASPLRHPEGGGHGSPHSRPDQQPGERGAAAALPARAPRPGAPPSPAGAHPAPDSPPAGRPCAQSGGVGPGAWSRGRLYVHTYTHTHTHTHTHRTRRVDFLRSSSSCFPCSRLGFWALGAASERAHSDHQLHVKPQTGVASAFRNPGLGAAGIASACNSGKFQGVPRLHRSGNRL